MVAAPPAFAGGDDGGGGDSGGGDGGGHGSDDGGGSGRSGSSGDDGGGSGHGGGDNDGDKDESSRARDAVRSGDAASLKEILAVVRQQYRGEVVRVRLNGSGARLVYNIRLLDTDNRLIEISVNAKSRRIVNAGATVY